MASWAFMFVVPLVERGRARENPRRARRERSSGWIDRRESAGRGPLVDGSKHPITDYRSAIANPDPHVDDRDFGQGSLGPRPAEPRSSPNGQRSLGVSILRPAIFRLARRSRLLCRVLT